MRLALAALFVALAPCSALAQSTEGVPPPPEDPAQGSAMPAASLGVGEQLEPPTAVPYRARIYQRPRAPGAPLDTRVPVDVLSWGEDELTLHARPRGSDESYTALCAAPCRLRLEPGAYEIAISPSGGGPRAADEQWAHVYPEPTAIQIHYDHRSGLRVLGWVFFSLGITAQALSAIGVWTALYIGLPLFSAFLIPFFVLAFLEDSAHVQVTPLDE